MCNHSRQEFPAMTCRISITVGMEHRWCGVRSSKPLRDRQALPWVGSIPTHPRSFSASRLPARAVFSRWAIFLMRGRYPSCVAIFLNGGDISHMNPTSTQPTVVAKRSRPKGAHPEMLVAQAFDPHNQGLYKRLSQPAVVGLNLLYPKAFRMRAFE